MARRRADLLFSNDRVYSGAHASQKITHIKLHFIKDSAAISGSLAYDLVSERLYGYSLYITIIIFGQLSLNSTLTCREDSAAQPLRCLLSTNSDGIIMRVTYIFSGYDTLYLWKRGPKIRNFWRDSNSGPFELKKAVTLANTSRRDPKYCNWLGLGGLYLTHNYINTIVLISKIVLFVSLHLLLK